MNNLHQAQSHDVLRSWQSQRNDVNHNKDFVLPMFIGNDDDSIEAIESMPEVYRYGGNKAIEYLEPLVYSYGLRAVLLFPVVTKKDHQDLGADHDGDDDDDADSDREILSSSNSSRSSSPTSRSSTSEDEVNRTILPKRLLLPDETGSPALSSQNPFLNQNEEEEHHLLDTTQDDHVRHSSNIADIASGKLHSIRTRKTSKSLDVKLIKGMALRDTHNPVLRLIPKLRTKFPELLIICDVCLCAFTSTGHCCLFDDHVRGVDETNYDMRNLTNPLNNFPISNKLSCQYLATLAVEYARRGCNVVAPSDMMDGRILTIRQKLDENRLHNVSIMSYSAKFASAFYGPFRQATNNAPEFGDRRNYQLPPGSRPMAMKAVERDISQGADFVMVKPGGQYLDIVRDINEKYPNIPVAVYQVSGEYSMLKLAAKANILDLKLAVNESLTAFRRAGASIIISYFTPSILKGEI